MNHLSVLTFVVIALLFGAPTGAEGAVLRVPDEFPTIQAAVESADPGDTVLIAPGDYPRAVTVGAAIVIAGETPGQIRLAGLSGSNARIEDVIFDAALDPARNLLVEAGEGLTLAGCSFEGIVQGVYVVPGARDVRLERCRFDRQIQAVTLGEGAAGLTLDTVTLTDCPIGVTGGEAVVCGTGETRPADRCSGGACATIRVVDCTVQGGETGIDLGAGYDLEIDSTTFTGTRDALAATGSRVTARDCVFEGAGTTGTGADLESVSGDLRRSSWTGYAIAVRIGDGGCPEQTDLAIGGSLTRGNRFENNALNLVVEQIDPVDADYNWWGSLDCPSVHDRIQGQTVAFIADEAFFGGFPCAVPVEGAGWGGIKRRFAGEDRR